LESILEQARQVRELLEAWVDDWTAQIWHSLWVQSPWWLRTVILLAAAIAVYESATLMLRRIGLVESKQGRRRRSR
jgi:hypothetical protein